MKDRADTLVLWYRSQPDHTTSLTDSEIAVKLHAVAPGEGWVTAHAPHGDKRLVRLVRRWVDNDRAGEFADVHFGTRRAGGRSYSNCYDGVEANVLAATLGSVSQIEATEHRMRAEAEERAREFFKYEAESKHWHDLGDWAKSTACHDAANDVQRYGHLTPATKSKLSLAGLAPL